MIVSPVFSGQRLSRLWSLGNQHGHAVCRVMTRRGRLTGPMFTQVRRLPNYTGSRRVSRSASPSLGCPAPAWHPPTGRCHHPLTLCGPPARSGVPDPGSELRFPPAGVPPSPSGWSLSATFQHGGCSTGVRPTGGLGSLGRAGRSVPVIWAGRWTQRRSTAPEDPHRRRIRIGGGPGSVERLDTPGEESRVYRFVIG